MITEKKKIRNILNSFVRTVILIVFALIIGINIYSINTKRVLNDAMPMPVGYGVAVVLSGSMENAISINDLIVVKKQENYEIGNIVVYQKQHHLVVHRIISIDGNEVITKGDANKVPDVPIVKSDIKGEVISIIPFMGLAFNFIKSPVGIFLILGLMIFLYKNSKTKEKQEKELELNQIREEIDKLKKK